MWAFATANKSFTALSEAVAQLSERRMGHLSAQKLANTVWARAAVFVVVAEVSEQRSGYFSAQELANTAWAFATAYNTEIG